MFSENDIIINNPSTQTMESIFYFVLFPGKKGFVKLKIIVYIFYNLPLRFSASITVNSGNIFLERLKVKAILFKFKIFYEK